MTPNVETNDSSGLWQRFCAVCSKDLTARDRRNARQANWRLFGWMACFLGVSVALRSDWLSGPVAYGVITLTTGIGVWAIAGYMRFLREADELLKRIQLEALAIGFGVAFIANFTLSMIERLTGSPFEVGDLFLLMVIGYAIGIFAGTRRYA